MEVERQPRPRRNLGSDTKYGVSVKGKHYPSHYTSKGEEKKDFGYGKGGGTVVPRGTGRPCLLAAHKNREVKRWHGLGSFELGFVFGNFW